MNIKIQNITQDDLPDINACVDEMWGGNPIIVHLDSYRVDNLAGITAEIDGKLVGFLHYEILGNDCEILTLASLQEGRGIGTALISAVENLARSRGCRRLHLITTNDNLHALGFYQRRGFHLSGLFPGRVAQSRQLKPTIPMIGDEGIPLRDEIQLEKLLYEGNDEEEL
ncbi:GNAT family N-acetyltransferase [bacterium]|nr:GNAT family N-acetyltransferase [bacterium]